MKTLTLKQAKSYVLDTINLKNVSGKRITEVVNHYLSLVKRKELETINEAKKVFNVK